MPNLVKQQQEWNIKDYTVRIVTITTRIIRPQVMNPFDGGEKQSKVP